MRNFLVLTLLFQELVQCLHAVSQRNMIGVAVDVLRFDCLFFNDRCNQNKVSECHNLR